MKKEMKHALVALGLSTLLVPNFANQVVSAQEESHETITSVSPEEVRKEIDNIKKSFIELQDKNKQKILNEIEQVDWETISFSQEDVNKIKNKIPEILSHRNQWFFGDLKRQEEEILNSSFYLQDWKERLYSINPSSRDELYEIKGIKREISEEILR
ncbi:N-acetylmuramoyl-L-alanine amidase family protein, partial [Streptococcus mitis]|nr:N-acetylmuramoyl-L-alanine amidase family protein [Streptococcus mitis]